MLKIILIVLALFWIARLILRQLPRIEITIQSGQDDPRIYAVMREHFPQEYEQYKHGLLSDQDERRVYLDCVEILGARQEIERL